MLTVISLFMPGWAPHLAFATNVYVRPAASKIIVCFLISEKIFFNEHLEKVKTNLIYDSIKSELSGLPHCLNGSLIILEFADKEV